ncbi:hypothetical protein AMTRI_Chr11g100300 [Amborella trichopoda]
MRSTCPCSTLQIFFVHLFWLTTIRILLTVTRMYIGILNICLHEKRLIMAVMGGFARIHNNDIAILVNDQTLEIAEVNVSRAESNVKTIEANLALK